MKKVFLIAVLTAILPLMIGCEPEEKTADEIQKRQTEQLMSEAQRQVGMPNIVNFQQRKLMKMIYELTDREDLICYAYIQSQYTGKLVFLGRCVGFGIPFSAQYTNPMKAEKISCGGRVGLVTLPQPDPNGLFMPTSSSATWLMLIDPETNKPRPVYVEPPIVVSPFPLPESVIAN